MRTRVEAAPIFVIGCGRSGTTLLYNLLAEHPDVGWFSNISQRMPRAPQAAALSRLHRHPAVVRVLGRRAPHPSEGHAIFDAVRGGRQQDDEGVLTGADLRAGEGAALARVMREHLRWQGRTRFINKNTRNARRIGYLQAAFPDAYFVHVVRDPRATAASLLRVDFWPEMTVWWADGRRTQDLVADGVDPAELAAEFWAREVQQIDSDALAVTLDRWIEVRYEDFVADPVGGIDRVRTFCALRDDASFRGRVQRVPVVGRNDKYRSVFAEEQLQTMWEIVAPVAARHGYGP